jgi:chromosome segregation ATPase
LSEEVEQLKAENETLSRQCSELETELATVKIERDDYAATVDEFIKDHKRWQERALTPEKRDRILNALGVGKQAPLYKRIKVVLDQFVNEV